MTQIFVGNLAFSTSEKELRSEFERYGRVASVRMASDRATGRPRGFAFVSMPRMEDADEAIHRLNGSSLSGRTIVVNEAQSDASSPSPVSPARSETLARWNLI